MNIKFTKKFVKLYNKSPLKIKMAFDNRLKLFVIDYFHPLLKNHILTGQYVNSRSINITGDWRALFIEDKVNGEIIITFIALGTHSQLYG